MAAAKPEKKKIAKPAGFQKRSEDVVGFWNPERDEAIIVVPRSYSLFDSKIEPAKPSVLFFAELVSPIELDTNDGEIIDGKAGDLIGIWGKPGLRQLRALANVPVFIELGDEKDTGKPNPMQLFDISSEKTGEPLPQSSDRRKLSAGKPTWIDS